MENLKIKNYYVLLYTYGLNIIAYYIAHMNIWYCY